MHGFLNKAFYKAAMVNPGEILIHINDFLLNDRIEG